MGSQIFDYWCVSGRSIYKKGWLTIMLGLIRRALFWSIMWMAIWWIRATLQTEARLPRTTFISGVGVPDLPAATALLRVVIRLSDPLLKTSSTGPDLPPTFLQ